MMNIKRITKEDRQKLEEGFSYGLDDAECCLYAGVTEEALKEYIGRRPEFKKRKELLKNTLRMRAKLNLAKKIYSEADKDSVPESKYYLERKCREEFSSKQAVEHNGEMTLNVVMEGEILNWAK